MNAFNLIVDLKKLVQFLITENDQIRFQNYINALLRDIEPFFIYNCKVHSISNAFTLVTLHAYSVMQQCAII